MFDSSINDTQRTCWRGLLRRALQLLLLILRVWGSSNAELQVLNFVIIQSVEKKDWTCIFCKGHRNWRRIFRNQNTIET